MLSNEIEFQPAIPRKVLHEGASTVADKLASDLAASLTGGSRRRGYWLTTKSSTLWRMP